MMQRNANYISILNNNELNDILSNSKNVLLDEFTGNKRVVAVIALKTIINFIIQQLTVAITQRQMRLPKTLYQE